MRWHTPVVLLVAVLVAVPFPAAARPGFYFTLGFGGTEVGGTDVPVGDIPDLSVPPSVVSFTTDNSDGISALLRLGFNFFGYGALEVNFTGNGRDIENDNRSWALHGQIGVRVYPAWHFKRWLPDFLHPIEPSLYWGWGLTYQVYAPSIPVGTTNLPAAEIGWRKIGSWRFGIGLEYFLFRYFKVGFDYNVAHASFDVFLFNFEDGIRRNLRNPAPTTYHQIFITVGFHGDPFGMPVPFEDDTPPPSPTKEKPELEAAPEVGATIESESAAETDADIGTEAETTPPDTPQDAPETEPEAPETNDGDEELIDI